MRVKLALVSVAVLTVVAAVPAVAAMGTTTNPPPGQPPQGKVDQTSESKADPNDPGSWAGLSDAQLNDKINPGKRDDIKWHRNPDGRTIQIDYFDYPRIGN